MMNPDCHFGDHTWRGGKCVACDLPFRCACGRFLRVEDLDQHLHECPWVIRQLREATE